MQPMVLESRPLCRVSIILESGAPIEVGRTPWRNRRISHITGGTFEGDRMSGRVVPGGGDWSELAMSGEGDALTLLDVRALWETGDGARIYVTYGGRLVIPNDKLGAFRDPVALAALGPGDYYFRIAPLFETADERYGWLNRIVAAGIGRRTADGVVYDIFEIV